MCGWRVTREIPFAAALLLVTALEGCTSPVQLFNGLSSGMSPDEIRRVMADVGWTVLYEHRAAGERSEFGRGILTVRIASYSHLNHMGEVLLYFHDDRLWQVDFFPKDFGSYVKALESRCRGVFVRTGDGPRAIRLRGHLPWRLGVYQTKDPKTGRPYVFWEDTCRLWHVRMHYLWS